MAAQTLQELYKLEPTGKEAVQKSAGYAVFNNMGTNLFLLSTARGAGIAVNSSRNGKTLRLESTQRCPFFHSFLPQSRRSNGHTYAFLRFEHALLIAPHGEDCDYTSVGRFPMKWTRPLEQFTELALVLWLWDLFGRPLFSFRHSTR